MGCLTAFLCCILFIGVQDFLWSSKQMRGDRKALDMERHIDRSEVVCAGCRDEVRSKRINSGGTRFVEQKGYVQSAMVQKEECPRHHLGCCSLIF